MKLDLFRDTTFELANGYALILQAWAFFANHYHLVVSFEKCEDNASWFYPRSAPRTGDADQPR
jgi:nuclear transport factor 2 (NTF2) superfamily protein